MTEVTAQARHKQSREAALEEMSLQTSAKSRQRGADIMCCGRPFHTCAAATGKALSPMVDRRVRRTASDEDGAERRRRRGLRFADRQSSSARYDGAARFTAFSLPGPFAPRSESANETLANSLP